MGMPHQLGGQLNRISSFFFCLGKRRCERCVMLISKVLWLWVVESELELLPLLGGDTTV